MSDAETIALLRSIAADEAGLPAALANRLNGESIAELRADAKRFARDAGYTDPQPRNERGQFASFNDAVRAAAGYPVTSQPEQPIGDLGIGRGGGAMPPPRPKPPSMSDLIRGAVSAKRSTAYQYAEQLASDV
jgi:hypothetical protein